MSLLVIPRNRTERSANYRVCSNGCLAARGRMVSGVREATHYAVILGRDVPLCQPCARDWIAIYEGASGVRGVAGRERVEA